MIDLLIVGPAGGTHIAGSFARAAGELGLRFHMQDTSPAYDGPGMVRSLVWRWGGRKPFRLKQFSDRIGRVAAEEPARRIVSIGQSPLTADTLAAARARGTACLLYSTDDPWNPAHRAGWYMRSLVHYDHVFTPRRSNIDDFRALGCQAVSYLPFGYDPSIFPPLTAPDGEADDAPEILFVGGADADRLEFVARLMEAGARPVLAGGYWDRHPKTRPLALGLKSPAELCRLTASAAVNLCLVRKANRDGHVMRSFEIPAVGGFLLAEDTAEHRAIFGEEGAAALYFNSPSEAAQKARWAIANPAERLAMARAAHLLVTTGGHTYKDRLVTMLKPVAA